MANYLQRLVERANDASDAQPQVTPFIRQWPMEGASGDEDPFASTNQAETPDAATMAPAVDKFSGSAENPRVERQEPKESTIAPKRQSYNQNQVQTKPVVHQRTEADITAAQPLTKTDRQITPDPLAPIETTELNLASSPRQTVSKPNRLTSKPQSISIEEPAFPSHKLSNTVPNTDAAEQSEMSRSQAREDGETSARTVPSSPSLIQVRTMGRSEGKNTIDLRPRNIMAPTNPPPSREEPHLVIGRLQVDVVPPQPEAPPPQPVRVAPRVERTQQKRGDKLPSKLRFGLGQL